MTNRARPCMPSCLSTRGAPWVAMTWSVLLLSACGGPDHEQSNMAPGSPAVQLGLEKDGRYVPLETGSETPVIWGLQGGTWTMPILRTRGIALPTHVEATLKLSKGERLGESEAIDDSLYHSEGWMETDRFSVPVQHAPPNQYESIADLYGQSAWIEVRAWDDADRSAEFSVEITLVEGS